MSPPTSRDKDHPPSPQELPLSTQRSTVFSSPPRSLSNDPEARKERRKPSITPRKFNRFFTPRSQGSVQLSSARQALQDITGRSRNPTQSSPLRPIRSSPGQENGPLTFTRDLKRRKIYHTPESSPEDLDDTKHKDLGCMVQDPILETDGNIQSSPCERAIRHFDKVEEGDEEEPPEPVQPIKQMVDRGLAAQVLQMSMGSSRTTRTSRQHYEYPVNGMLDFHLYNYMLMILF